MPTIRDFPTKKELRTARTLQFGIIVPSTRNQEQRIGPGAFNKRVREATEFFTKLFGGATITVAEGSYKGRRGRVMEEPVAVINVYTTTNDWNKNDKHVKRWLMKKKTNWGQESMGFMFDEDLILV
jgi:hypothetical protein